MCFPFAHMQSILETRSSQHKLQNTRWFFFWALSSPHSPVTLAMVIQRLRYGSGLGFRVLQCVAVCCSVLQCVAVCCSVIQCGHHSTYRALQCIEVCWM